MKDIRGSGRTTKQMQEAPLNAIFVWNNAQLDYPKSLASKIARNDLVIVPPGWVRLGGWVGRRVPGLVIDHGCVATDDFVSLCNRARATVREVL
jgi:hypothetical protein